jgi:hypothetical protein
VVMNSNFRQLRPELGFDLPKLFSSVPLQSSAFSLGLSRPLPRGKPRSDARNFRRITSEVYRPQSPSDPKSQPPT